MLVSAVDLFLVGFLRSVAVILIGVLLLVNTVLVVLTIILTISAISTISMVWTVSTVSRRIVLAVVIEEGLGVVLLGALGP